MFHIEPVTTYPKDYTAVMLLGLFMNASVTRAFTTSGWAFVFPLLLIQLGRTVWTLVNSASVVLREHYIRALIWVIATTPLWIAGAADNAEARLLWWRWPPGSIRSAGGWRIPFPAGGCVPKMSRLTRCECLDPRNTSPIVMPDMNPLPDDQVSWANVWLWHR